MSPLDELYESLEMNNFSNRFSHNFLIIFTQILCFTTAFAHCKKVIASCKYYIYTFQEKITHFMSLVLFHISSKYHKTYGFLMFSGGIERDQWHEMG